MIRALSTLLLAVAALTGCARNTKDAANADASAGFGKLRARPDAGRFLGRDSARASAAGAERSQVLAIDAGAAGDRVSGMVSVPERQCVLLIARAGDSVDDVDLFAYGDDGTVLGADEGADKEPTLLVCPPHPRRIFVSARIAGGHGLVAIGAQRLSPRDADGVGKALSARGRPGEALSRLAIWPELEEKLAAHRRFLGSRWQDVGRLALPVDARLPSHVSVVVDADRCLNALIVGTDEVSHLEASVLDLGGRILGRAAASGRDRWLLICAADKTPLTLEVRPHAGRGIVAVLLSRSVERRSPELEQRAVVHELGEGGELAEVQRRVRAQLERAGYRQSRIVGQGSLPLGRRTSLPVELPSGCARLDLLGGKPLRGLEAWLWAEDGALLAAGRGTSQATLFACGAGGKARLDAEPVLRAGRYVLELRPELGAPKTLQRAPLAASRLLASVVTRGLVSRAGELGGAELIDLSSTQLQTRQALVPVGRCLDFTLALGAGALGAEVRLVDRATRNELGYARGSSVAAARACALDRPHPLDVSVELRSAAGVGPALFATRLVAPAR